MSVQGLVVLARHLRDGFGSFDPSSPWTSGKCWETQGAFGGNMSLFPPPACKCPSSYQTLCPEAGICPGTKTSVLKLLELI